MRHCIKKSEIHPNGARSFFGRKVKLAVPNWCGMFGFAQQTNNKIQHPFIQMVVVRYMSIIALIMAARVVLVMFQMCMIRISVVVTMRNNIVCKSY